MHVLIDGLFPNPAMPSHANLMPPTFAMQYLKHRPSDKVTIVTGPTTLGDLKEARLAGVEVDTGGPNGDQRLRRIVSQQTYLASAFRRHRADVLLCQGNVCPLWPGMPIVLQIATMHHARFFWSIGMARASYRHTMVSLSAARADRVVANSTSNAKDIVRSMPWVKRKMATIPEAVDPFFLEPFDFEQAERAVRENFSLPQRFALVASAVWPYKNLETAIRAIGAARKKVDLSLVIAGALDDRAYLDTLTGIVKELELHDAVRFLGHIHWRDLRSLYRAATLFLYPSLYETFGHPPLQAMTQGCPVVASNVSSIPEVVDDAAVLLDPTDVSGWATAITNLADDPQSQSLYRERGLARARIFNWGAVIDAFHALFTDAVAGR